MATKGDDHREWLRITVFLRPPHTIECLIQMKESTPAEEDAVLSVQDDIYRALHKALRRAGSLVPIKADL